jgi:hypothetical protein
MIVAVEDALSEAVAQRLVTTVRPDLTIWSVMGKRGQGYLQKRRQELNTLAQNVVVFLLIDQDVPARCGPERIRTWFPTGVSPHLLFRVVVMEVESWVMAHREALAASLQISENDIPLRPDTIARPKEHLVGLARSSRSSKVRADLVPSRGSTATVGPAYNPHLVDFVTTTWHPYDAAANSPSLQTTIGRLYLI